MEQKEQKDAIQENIPRIRRKKEWILAGILLIAGWIYSGLLTGNSQDFLLYWIGWNGSLCLFTAVFAGAVFYGGKAVWPVKPDKDAGLYLIFTAAAALWIGIFGGQGDQDITGYVVLFLHGAAVYWVLAASNSRLDGCLNERGLADLARGFFTLPFVYFGKWFGALRNLLACMFESSRQNSRKVQQAAAGLLLSIPLLAIAAGLLIGADPDFAAVASNVLKGLSYWLNGFLGNIDGVIRGITGMIICCYLFGLIYGAYQKEEKPEAKHSSLPVIMLTAFLLTFLALYGVFFLIKLAAVPQALSSIRRGELLRSAYAREGFFQLCWIAAINFGIFSFVKWYWPEGNGTEGWKKWLLSFLGVQTLAFISLAMFRMGFYIAGYGLTFKRVFTTWFMVVLLVTFVLLMLENWKKQVWAIRRSVVFGCITFLMLAYSNLPAWAG